MVCAEISHKVMRNETIYDLLKAFKTEERDFKTKSEQALLGATVLTKYNNKTYRIDDIKWDLNPQTTFDKRGTQVSLIDYYQVKKKLIFLCEDFVGVK